MVNYCNKDLRFLGLARSIYQSFTAELLRAEDAQVEP